MTEEKTDMMLEAFAALVHETWAHWTEHMMDRIEVLMLEDQALEMIKAAHGMFMAATESDPAIKEICEKQVVAMESMKRWRRQMKTPYAELSEEEKKSDREFAEKFIELAQDYFP
jgi:hypothetical protein